MDPESVDMPEPASIVLFGTGCFGLVARYMRKEYRPLKPCFDWCAGFVLFALSLPLMAFIALLVKLTSRGPAFYKQERVGRNGRTFTLLKLRTMRVDAETQTGPIWSAGGSDPRVTPLGAFLRKTHLDELPQLINVLRGDMSLVGPRPERPHFVDRLKHEVPEYERRLSIRPGITGLAQIRAGADRTLRDVRRKLRLDLMYIRHMCWWLDFLILAKTVARVFAGSPHGQKVG